MEYYYTCCYCNEIHICTEDAPPLFCCERPAEFVKGLENLGINKLYRKEGKDHGGKKSKDDSSFNP